MAQSINDIVAAALAKKTATAGSTEAAQAREITSHAGSSIKTKSASGLFA